METSKKTPTNIVRAYQRYLKLQRGYSPNTLDAYVRDLQKLLVKLNPIADELKALIVHHKVTFLAVTILVFIRGRNVAYSVVCARSIVSCSWTAIVTTTPRNCWSHQC